MARSDRPQTSLRALVILFWALAAAYGTLLAAVLLPPVRTLIRPAFLLLMGLCFVLGLALLILSIRTRPITLLGKYTLLSGASSTGFALFSVLHNAFYALAQLTADSPLLSQAMEVLEVATFILGVLVCPVAFVVGAVGAAVLLIRARKQGRTD
jgi:hypothetical protein